MNLPRRLLPSIAALRALEALDRLGSASAAAEELSLTQGAVSRQLRALEGQLGVELVLRDAKRLAPTPEAAAYAGEIRQALGLIAQATLRVQSAPLGGALNLAILPTFGMRWLMPRLPDFARRHPEVTVNMSTRIHRFNFAAETFDAALHFGSGDWPGTDRLLLRTERVLPVCAPELLPRPLPAPDAVLGLPLLHIETRPRAWADWLARYGIDRSAPLPGTVHDQFSTITQAALHGLGVALMPDYLVEPEIAAGRLVPAFGAPVEAEGAYWLVWPREKARLPALRLFRDWLATCAEAEDPLPR